MRRFLTVSLLCGCLALASCIDFPNGVACTLIYVYGLNVTVTDAVTSVRVGSATVTIVDGAYQETLQTSGGGDFIGAGERAGNYQVTVSAPGYETKIVENVVVTGDICHVHPRQLDVALQPSP